MHERTGIARGTRPSMYVRTPFCGSVPRRIARGGVLRSLRCAVSVGEGVRQRCDLFTTLSTSCPDDHRSFCSTRVAVREVVNVPQHESTTQLPICTREHAPEREDEPGRAHQPEESKTRRRGSLARHAVRSQAFARVHEKGARRQG